MDATGSGGVGRRVVAALLSVVLATSGVPASAYAEAANELSASSATTISSGSGGSSSSTGETQGGSSASSASESAGTGASDSGSQSGKSAGSGSTSGATSTSASTGTSSASSATSATTSAASTDAATSSSETSSTDASLTISSAYLTMTNDPANSGSYWFTVSDTIWVWAKEEGASSTIDPAKLSYQWQVSDSRRGTYTDIAGATQQSLSLANLEGKYVRCKVSVTGGDSSYTTRSRNPVAAAGSVYVSKATLDASDKVEPGTTLTASAAGTGGVDVTGSVTWSWFSADDDTSTGTQIAGATSNTFATDSSLSGKYVYAVASGGFGNEETSRVKVAAAGTVKLHHVEVSGSATIGSTLSATAYTSSYTKAAATDKVSYQWQVASSKTTDDSAFTNIDGATSSTLTLTSDLIGKYVRVVATSDGSVASTSKPSYYGTTSVDPPGPVSLKGAYDLTSVELSSSDVDAHAGATLSATAQYMYGGSYGSYEKDVPDDAQVTYTWYAQASDSSEAKVVSTQTVTGSSASTLELTDELVGQTVWVEASAQMTPATSSKLSVSARGTYSLRNANFSDSSKTFVTGDTLAVRVYANNLRGTGTEVTDQPGVSLQWYVADSADASNDQWVALDGQAKSSLTIPAEAAGKYVKVVATSGSSTTQAVYSTAVVDANSAQGIAAKLSGEGYSGWKPSPTYGTDTNVNDMLLAHLAELGVDTSKVKVSVKSANFRSTSADATVGISTSDADNGSITYYAADPDKVGTYAADGLSTVSELTYVIECNGSSTEYVAKNVRIPWDEAKAAELLQQKADALAISFADGDSAESVTQAATLPYKAGSPVASWTSVSWASNSDALAVSGYGWDDYTATPVRGATDQTVTLTATVSGLSNYGMPDKVSVTKTFTVTVKADPAKVEEQSKQLAANLDTGLTYDSVKAFQTGDAVSPEAVTTDLQMPRPSKLGVDGGDYRVTYTSDSDAVSFNGYHGIVVRPLGSDATVNVTCTVTSKTNPQVTASKTLTYVVKAVSEDDIDAELSLMERAKQVYKSALLGSGTTGAGQTEPVQNDLSTFQKIYEDASGNLVIARTTAEASQHVGIVPTEVDGYQDMGPYDQARLFKSSNKSVVLNETLQLAWHADRSTSLSQYHDQPRYNTTVTVSSKLTSERYGAYYQKYKDDSSVSDSLKGKLAQLASTDVSADVSVAGTTGEDQSQVQVSVSIIGQDQDGNVSAWASLPSASVAPGTTADAVVKQALSDAGLDYQAKDTSYGWYLETITKDGRTLGYDASTGKYWQFYVNGKASNVGMSGYALKDGDVVTLAYSAFGDPVPTVPTADTVTTTTKVRVRNADGTETYWVESSTDEAKAGETASDVTKAALDAAGITYDDSLFTFTKGDQSLGWDPATGAYWHFYVNGAMSSLMASNVTASDGDVYEWVYESDASHDENDVTIDPSAYANRPTDYTSDWPTYRGADGTNTTTASTPTQNAKAAWATQVYSRTGSSDMTGVSEPILVNGNLYIATGSKLEVIDPSTGKVKAKEDGSELSSKLVASIDSVSRMIYTDGLIIVPLHGGRLQALTADTLTTVWVTDAVNANDSDQQALSSLTVSDGYVYVGTTNAYGTKGYLRRVNLMDGSVSWTYQNDEAGYYWCGGQKVESGILVTTGSGKVELMSEKGSDGSAQVLATLALLSKVRSSVVVSSDGKTAYVTGYDGVLYQLGIDGTSLTLQKQVSFGAYSTGTPTLSNGKLYIGGAIKSGSSYQGALFVVDTSTFEVKTITQATDLTGATASLPGAVASSPLVATRSDGSTYVYFTANNNPGGALVYKLGDDKASWLYIPDTDKQNYSMDSLVVDSAGNLYLMNDSGYLFKLSASSQPAPGGDPSPEPSPNPDPIPNPNPIPNPRPNPTPRPSSNNSSKTLKSVLRKSNGTASNGSGATSATSQTSLLNPFWLLGNEDSDTLQGESTTASTSSDTLTKGDASAEEPTDATSSNSATRQLPLWPIIVMAVAAAAFVIALVWRRRNNNEAPQRDGRA